VPRRAPGSEARVCQGRKPIADHPRVQIIGVLHTFFVQKIQEPAQIPAVTLDGIGRQGAFYPEMIQKNVD
jgi:hypothetical protein